MSAIGRHLRPPWCATGTAVGHQVLTAAQQLAAFIGAMLRAAFVATCALLAISIVRAPLTRPRGQQRIREAGEVSAVAATVGRLPAQCTPRRSTTTSPAACHPPSVRPCSN